MSAPWIKFFPTDWQADDAVKSCSLSARGLWIEMLCVMQKSDPRGYLTINGNPIAPAKMASLCGAPVATVNKALTELEAAGVFSRTEGGVIYSRRMVRDQERAERDKANGSKGGNPRLKGGVNPPDKGEDKAQKPEARSQKPESDAREPRLPSDLLDKVWSAAPAKARERSSRGDTAKALAAALKRGALPDDILEGLQSYWRSDDATKDNGAYAKGVHRMIADDRWRDWTSTALIPAGEAPDWKSRLYIWRSTEQWHHGPWGAAPGDPRCTCPPDLLTESERRGLGPERVS